MKIALMGYGKMGQLVEQLAQQRDHEILTIISRSQNQQDQRQMLEAVDMAIDFSHADCILEHVEICKKLNKSLVIGTTGWEIHLPQVKKMVADSQMGCLYSPNFSLGIYLFTQIVSYAAQLFSPFTQYDVSGIEAHHRQKADAPSGTAKALTQQIMKHMPELKDFHFCNVRCGSIPGTHSLLFDSLSDTITLTHQARNREGFAHGALLAAEWLKGKKGFFTLDDMLLPPEECVKQLSTT